MIIIIVECCLLQNFHQNDVHQSQTAQQLLSNKQI